MSAKRSKRDAPPQPLPDFFTCNFCGKSQKEARVIIQGPCVCICDECVEICVGILAEHLGTYGPLRNINYEPGV